jgi:hypothetical protein
MHFAAYHNQSHFNTFPVPEDVEVAQVELLSAKNRAAITLQTDFSVSNFFLRGESGLFPLDAKIVHLLSLEVVIIT